MMMKINMIRKGKAIDNNFIEASSRIMFISIINGGTKLYNVIEEYTIFYSLKEVISLSIPRFLLKFITLKK